MEVAEELEEGDSLVGDNNIDPLSPYGVNDDSTSNKHASPHSFQ